MQRYYIVVFIFNLYFYISQTDVEYNELLMTYQRRRYMPGAMVFNASHYSANLPESVDWRTNNAVTSIKDQVREKLQNSQCKHESFPNFAEYVWCQLCLQCCRSSGGS